MSQKPRTCLKKIGNVPKSENESCHLTIETLGNVMRELGFCPSTRELHDMLMVADPKTHASLNFETFCTMLQRAKRGMLLRDAFDEMDRNGDGCLSRGELCEGMENAFQDLPLDPFVVDAMMREADPDNSGFITFDRFIDLSLKYQTVDDEPDV
ncbi:blast:Calmodulin [Drosophila guanche]|uniref:Blast:Calmodulin n=1 Tax=Drosophila guanche TaxID=7266 RepID=A0A3B0KNA8_DROGU|nr:blast:Calmodulin [Drosophila guanche]